MHAIVIGGGPVGCLAASRLRQRGFEVTVHERGPDPRAAPGGGRAASFNLTLTERGLGTLAPALRRTLLDHGVPCRRRIVHHADGTTEAHGYGTDGQFLLSVPRGRLHRVMLDEAERAGADVRFGQSCVTADTRTGRVVVLGADGTAREHIADLVLGCDGAGSTVRNEMVNHGGRIDVRQSFVAHGYTDLHLPPGPAGHPALAGPADPARDGLHVWPRGGFLLLGQPNRDGSATLTLFLPLESPHPSEPDFRALADPTAADAFLRRHFPDIADRLPHAGERLAAATPRSLRTVTCGTYHHGRGVLLGDAAHTMLPFFGQGINCSFEDVHALDTVLARAAGPSAADLPSAAAAFTRLRRDPCHAITELSRAHLATLSAPADPAAARLARLEEQLHRAHPGEFVPLYTGIAFSSVPYDRVRDTYQRHRRTLDDLLTRYDPATETPLILGEFARVHGAPALCSAAAPTPERSPA